MNLFALIGGSLAAILPLAVTARLLGLGTARLATPMELCELAESTFADLISRRNWLDIQGQGGFVLAEDGRLVLVRRVGARFVARLLPAPIPLRSDGAVIHVPRTERLLGPCTITLESEAEARLLTSVSGERRPNG